MFRRRSVRNVEELLVCQCLQKPHSPIKQVQMTTDHTFHFMSMITGKENYLLVLITNRKAILGMGWTSTRTALQKLAPYFP